jgi:poly(hydroxyalkanoate) depolymerase family esterase
MLVWGSAAALALNVRVTPRHLTAGVTTVIRVAVGRNGRPVAHALVQLGRFHRSTNAAGVARISVRFLAAKPEWVVVKTGGSVSSPVRIGVNYAPFPGPGRYSHASFTFHGDVYHYSLYVPASLTGHARVPLLVMIHGCTTTDDQQAAASEYDPLAVRKHFVVLYPDVDAADIANDRCWKGLLTPSTEGRGRGDAGAIAAMTRVVMSRWRIDRTRVYAIGMSSGAFETSILAAAYPDLYTAIGIHSGGAYTRGAKGCVVLSSPYQSGPPTALLAGAAYAAMNSRARVMPVIVFHGDNDHTVDYRCGQQALHQWLATDNLVLRYAHKRPIPSDPSHVSQGGVPAGYAYTVLSYASSPGCPLAQIWTIHDMGHFWSGGSPEPGSKRFTDPEGPSAADASWAFFSAHRLRVSGIPSCT